MRFERVSSGVYVDEGRRFRLTKRGQSRWRLCLDGELVGYKPSASRRFYAQTPIWLRSNSAKAAVAWAITFAAAHRKAP